MIPFLPRSVTRKLPTASTRSTPGRHLTSGQATASKTQTVEAIEPHPSQSDNKGKHKDVCATPAYDEEYACLVYLSMSEYALWSNPDLRRRLEMSDEGFIPLAYLMEHLAPLSPITNELTEATLVKTIRTHAADTFDVRMLMANPSRAGWYGKDISHETSKGGFEVRRKDWREVLSCARNRSRRDWEGLTVYVENIPLQYRTVPGIFKFIQSLTDVAYTTAISTELQVQQILLPKHFRDKATDQPKCKGFALVTLSSTEGLEYLLHRWPWQRRINAADEDWSPQECEAHKFGFRVLPKAQWAALNEEYIAYRQSLLNQIAETEVPELHAKSDLEEVVEREIPALTPAPPEPESSDHGQTTIASPYPYNCLVFVRNIHPETNKTTLRTLFAKAFMSSDRVLPFGEGVDYVDFNKGMNTCFLRLATPIHAEVLIAHLSSTPTTQTDGLDASGHSPTGDKKPIAVELVDGTREELYWGKVPERVRRQAVERVVAATASNFEVRGTCNEEEGGGESQTGPRRRRKRRKMDS